MANARANKVRPAGEMAARVPQVMQLEALECGAASLAMVCACYGKWLPLEQVRRDRDVAPLGRVGVMRDVHEELLECQAALADRALGRPSRLRTWVTSSWASSRLRGRRRDGSCRA